jgi:hypothetical protein
VARALRELPQIFRAYAEGKLSWDQLRPLTSFATAEADAYWANRAPSMGPAALYREAERRRRVQARDEADARRRRYLTFHWDHEAPSPVLYLEAMLPAQEGSAVQHALERRSEQVVLVDDPDMPGEARLADALVELTTAGGEAGPAPAALVVHADASALTGEEPSRGPWLCETEAGIRLSSEAVRRLACDARIEWVLESGGRPVGIGRRGRNVPGPLGRVLRHRDGGCGFPGCRHRRWVQAHHLHHWGKGGATDLDNLVLLCHAHHKLVHEGGWRTSGRPGRDLRFHDPGGRTLRALRSGEIPSAGPVAQPG